jgi:hypothetical protein
MAKKKRTVKEAPTKVRMNFRLDPSQVQWMKKFAKKNEMTVTAVVELALNRVEDAKNGR